MGPEEGESVFGRAGVAIVLKEAPDRPPVPAGTVGRALGGFGPGVGRDRWAPPGNSGPSDGDDEPRPEGRRRWGRPAGDEDVMEAGPLEAGGEGVATPRPRAPGRRAPHT